MDVKFWQQRWQDNQIGFHLDQVNPLLLRYASELNLTRERRIFVPLCGKTKDMHWLQQQGCEVVGVELSEMAVQQFFAEGGFEPVVEKQAGLMCYQANGITIYCGDFFELTPAMLGKIDAVYDRAALIALPEHMRSDYARHLTRLTQAAPQLLIALDYDQSQMAGPPFSVTAAEIENLYGADYQVESLERDDVIEQEPRFKQKGILAFYQSVYALRQK